MPEGGFLIVRSLVSSPEDRKEFDGWYSHHLREAIAAFGALIPAPEQRESAYLRMQPAWELFSGFEV
jgi:hypothetical protein